MTLSAICGLPHRLGHDELGDRVDAGLTGTPHVRSIPHRPDPADHRRRVAPEQEHLAIRQLANEVRREHTNRSLGDGRRAAHVLAKCVAPGPLDAVATEDRQVLQIPRHAEASKDELDVRVVPNRLAATLTPAVIQLARRLDGDRQDDQIEAMGSALQPGDVVKLSPPDSQGLVTLMNAGGEWRGHIERILG